MAAVLGVIFLADTLIGADHAVSRIPYGDVARAFSSRVTSLNLREVEVDDSLSKRALSLYLSSLDGDHSIFLASDVEEFRKWETSLDDLMKAGDVTPAFEIYRILRTRAGQRLAFIESMLANDVELSGDETYAWKRRDAPWPADESEQNELWRKKIKDQLIRRRVLSAISKKKDGVSRTNVTVEIQYDTVISTNSAEAAEGWPAGQAGVGGARVAAATNTGEVLKDGPASDREAVIRQFRQYVTVLRDTDDESVFQMFMSAVGRACDPHSEYMSPATVEDFDISMRLSLTGIGALLMSEDGAAKVERLIPGGAAERDGRLKPNDKIVAVAEGDGEPVDIMHWPLSKAVRLIRGPKGKKVVLSVIPAADPTRTVKIAIVRDEVKLEEQEAKSAMRDIKVDGGNAVKVGLVTLPSFYSDMKARSGGAEEYKSSTRDVDRMLREMKAAGVKGILLDLRNNGGGSLNEAVDMTGLFITIGPVVQVKDRRNISALADEDPDVAYDGPLVVLVDRFSASASEILAAALQDYGRAIIVGDSRTHGKGTVQTVLPLRTVREDWGSMKVTTAGFYRFTGDSTQVKGVASDVVIRSVFDVMEVGEEYLDNAMPWSKISPFDFSRQASGGTLDGLMFWRVSRPEYQEVRDLMPVIERLKTRSVERRRADERFVTRGKLLEEFEKRQRNPVVVLNLEKRVELAVEESNLGTQPPDDRLDASTDDRADAPDLVLEEALNILAEFAGEEGRWNR